MKIAIIGLGMVARTHVAAIRAMGEHAQLLGVLSRDTAKATTFLQQVCPDLADSVTIYPDLAALAADDRVEAVALLTPPNARQEQVEALAAAGKHILMEKPVERTLSAATRIVETCETHGVKLGVFLQHRMRERVQDMQRLLDSGALGKVALVEVSVPWWREQAYYDEPGRGTYARDGGGVLISQSIHTLDLMLALLGPVAKVHAMARTTALHNMESEDFVSAGLEFASGAVGSLTASTASFPGGGETITVHGENGSAVLSSGTLRIAYRDGRNETLGTAATSGGGADPMTFTSDWHRGIYEDFAAALTENRAPVVSGRTALDVQQLIETLIQSSQQGRALPVPSTETSSA